MNDADRSDARPEFRGSDVDLAPDVLVVGGGIAGVVAAARAKELGARVMLVKKSGGATAVSSGAIDVADELIGTTPSEAIDALDRGGRVRRAMDSAAGRMVRHPYARVGAAGRDRMRESLALLKSLAPAVDLVERDDGQNHVVATQAGTVRRAALVQRAQLLDLCALDDKAVVGIVQLSDLAGFDARTVAQTLSWACGLGKRSVHVVTVVVPRTLAEVCHAPLELARALDLPSLRAPIIEQLREQLRASARVPTHLLFAPTLGLTNTADIIADIEKATGKITRELLAMHNSVPGERLARALHAGIKARGVVVVDGHVGAASVVDGHVQRVVAQGARMTLDLKPRAVVLATGRFFGGGIVRDQTAIEPVLDLPVVVGGPQLGDRFIGDFLGARPTDAHALFRAGVAVDARMRPVSDTGAVLLHNVTCAGAVVEGWDPARDGTAGGVSAVCGLLAGENAATWVKGPPP